MLAVSRPQRCFVRYRACSNQSIRIYPGVSAVACSVARVAVRRQPPVAFSEITKADSLV